MMIDEGVNALTYSEFTFQTNDGVEIYYCKWDDSENQPPKGVIQIAHGMAEHILRYVDFAQHLVQAGYIVYGHDHRGHGRTAKRDEEIGYFADENGFDKVVDDVKQLTTIIQQEHPHLPIILFGHSMGSFIARRYVQLYGDEIAGAIFCGTGGDPGLLGKLGKIVAMRECRKKGRRTPSPLLDQLSFGNFNKQFEPNRTKFDWLSRDEQQVDLYVEDPMCGEVFTGGFFLDLFSGIELIHRKEEMNKMPKNLPMLFISGDKDPVGNNGKGVKKVVDLYQRAGVKSVSLKLYQNARHEILNETNKEEVFRDIVAWVDRISAIKE